MGLHAKTLRLIETARAILADYRPMTVRQVYYQLVSRQDIENSRAAYQAVSKALVAARQDGVIPWEWIEDRLRRPRHTSMWRNPREFLATVRDSYRRDTWQEQPGYVECWLEKDALSGIFQDVLKPYGVTLNVGRGYDGWDSIRGAARRYGSGEGVAVLYWGDFDPSGEDMARSLAERLAFFECRPSIVKCALVPEDIERYRLPPDPTKTTDKRREAFIARHGDRCVELDALPADVLRGRIVGEVEARLDMPAIRRTWDRERQDQARLQAVLDGLAV